MTYILFAICALISSIGNTIFNRISSHKIGSVLSATIKSFMITIACFFICLAFGNVKILYALTKEQWLWLFLLGIVTVIDWLFYFLALKRSYLEAFAPFEAAAILFMSNFLFSIFLTDSATKGGSTRNILLVAIGLAFVLASMIYITFNKKINPAAKLTWIIYSLVSATALAFTLVIATKIQSTGLTSDVIAFHQMFIVFVVCCLMLLFSKDKREIKNTKPKVYLNFFISAVFNALMMVFRYLALGAPNNNPAVISVIIGLDFVFVSITTVIFFKANNKKELTILIILVVAGMVLNALPEIL